MKFTKTSVSELARTDKFAEMLCNNLKGAAEDTSTFDVNTLDACKKLDMTPLQFHQHLLNLKYSREINFEEYQKSYFIIIGKIDYGTEEGDEKLTGLKNALVEKLSTLEKSKVQKLEEINGLMKLHSFTSINQAIEQGDLIDRQGFINSITEYFNADFKIEQEIETSISRPILHLDLKQFIAANKDIVTNARIVARIFQGISSPKYPAFDWNRNEYWNKYANVKFEELYRLAKKVLIDMRQKRV